MVNRDFFEKLVSNGTNNRGELVTEPPLWSLIRWGTLAGSRCHRVAITEVQAVPKHSIHASI